MELIKGLPWPLSSGERRALRAFMPSLHTHTESGSSRSEHRPPTAVTAASPAPVPSGVPWRGISDSRQRGAFAASFRVFYVPRHTPPGIPGQSHQAGKKMELHRRSVTHISSVMSCQGLMPCEGAEAMGSSTAVGAELERHDPTQYPNNVRNNVQISWLLFR